MANSHIQTLVFILSCTSLLLTQTQTKLVLPLIYLNSVLSPFHNPKTLTTDDSSSFPPDDIRAPLSPEPNGVSFMVNISIGQPPVPQLLALDTGSRLTWICTNCSPPLNPLFDPHHSSTYKNISCLYQYECQSYNDYADCQEYSQCTYRVRYMDQSVSRGLLAMEKFTFVTSSGGIAEIPDVVLGIGLENIGNFRMLSGVLGLEPFNGCTLVSRVGNKFSYCIGNISNPYYMYNQLILGDGSIFEGSSTPMRFYKGHYAVKLEGISVGGKQLSIDQREYNFNVIIDSGTTLTMLQRNGFDALKEEVKRLMDGTLKLAGVIKNSGGRPCYYGNLVRDLTGFPVVSLSFAGGTVLDIGVEGLFQRLDDEMFCMAVGVSRDNMNIIGVYAQQYYNVGFDLDAMKISFQYIECELLE